MPTLGELLYETGQISEESLISGKLEHELEYTIYVELDDLNELKKRAIHSERHEQWTVPLAQERVDGKMRIRLIDDARPTMCTKIKRNQEVGSEEVEADIPIALFNHLREFAEDGYVKTRYKIPSNIQGRIWEVDVFLTNGGGECPWVKVDLEVQSLNDTIPAFPISHGRVIWADGDLTHSEKLKIKELWDKSWQKIPR